jgi:hypothetical protein
MDNNNNIITLVTPPSEGQGEAVAEAAVWDATKKFYEQSPEAQALMSEALQAAPLESESEPCGRNMADRRILWATYKFGNATLRVTNTYLNAPDNAAWGALRGVEYAVLGN